MVAIQKQKSRNAETRKSLSQNTAEFGQQQNNPTDHYELFQNNLQQNQTTTDLNYFKDKYQLPINKIQKDKFNFTNNENQVLDHQILKQNYKSKQSRNTQQQHYKTTQQQIKDELKIQEVVNNLNSNQNKIQMSQNSNEYPIKQPIIKQPYLINNQIPDLQKLADLQIPKKISGKTSSSLFTIGITSNMSQSGLDEGGPVHAIQIDFNKDSNNQNGHTKISSLLQNKQSQEEQPINLRMRFDITLQNNNSDQQLQHVYIDDQNLFQIPQPNYNMIQNNRRRNIMQQQFNSQSTNAAYNLLTNANLTGTNSSESLQNYKFQKIDINPKLHAYKNTIDHTDCNNKRNISAQRKAQLQQAPVYESIKRIQTNFNSLKIQQQQKKDQQSQANKKPLQPQKLQQQQQNKNQFQSFEIKAEGRQRNNLQSGALKSIIDQQIIQQTYSIHDLNFKQHRNIPLRNKLSKQSDNYLHNVNTNFNDQIYKTSDNTKTESLNPNDFLNQKKISHIRQILSRKNFKIQNKSLVKNIQEGSKIMFHNLEGIPEIKKRTIDKSEKRQSRNNKAINQIITLTSQSQQSQLSNYILSQGDSSQESLNSMKQQSNQRLPYHQKKNRCQRRTIQQKLYHQKVISSAHNSNNNEVSEQPLSNQQNQQDQFIIIENQEHISIKQMPTPQSQDNQLQSQSESQNLGNYTIQEVTENISKDFEQDFQDYQQQQKQQQQEGQKENASQFITTIQKTDNNNQITLESVDESYQINDVEQSLVSESQYSQSESQKKMSSIMTKLIIKSDIENSENFLQYNESINNNDRK